MTGKCNLICAILRFQPDIVYTQSSISGWRPFSTIAAPFTSPTHEISTRCNRHAQQYPVEATFIAIAESWPRSVLISLSFSFPVYAFVHYTAAADVCVCVLVVRILYFHRLVIGAVGDSNKTISGSERRRRADFFLIFLLNVSRCTPRLVSIPKSNRVK